YICDLPSISVGPNFYRPTLGSACKRGAPGREERDKSQNCPTHFIPLTRIDSVAGGHPVGDRLEERKCLSKSVFGEGRILAEHFCALPWCSPHPFRELVRDQLTKGRVAFRRSYPWRFARAAATPTRL